MVDGWGNKFRYAVDVAYTANGYFSTVPIGCAPGAITMYNSNGLPGSNFAPGSINTIYAVISHGANGHGAYTKNGAIVNAGSTNTAELINCHCDSNGITTTTGGVQTSSNNPAAYVQMPPTIDPSSTTDNFDDIVVYKERWQMQTPWDQAGGCKYVWVVDAGNNRIQLFDLHGNYYTTISSVSGVSPSTFSFSTSKSNGIAVSSAGIFFVSDPGNNRVVSYYGTSTTNPPGSLALDSSNNLWVSTDNQTGNTSGTLTEYYYYPSVSYYSTSATWGTAGTAVGQFYSYDIAFDKNGYLWVADGGNARVQKCTTSSSTLSCTAITSSTGQFGTPEGITVDPYNNIWIWDIGHSNPLQWLSNNGIVQTQSYSGVGTGACMLTAGAAAGTQHIAADPNGNIWVSDPKGNRVWEMSPGGTCIRQIGCTGSNACSSGSSAGQFNSPQEIAIGPSR